jgi:hypothetical protein
MYRDFQGQGLAHLAYSPNRAPSNVFLFGYLKEKLMDFNSHTQNDLTAATTQIFHRIEKAILRPVITSLMKRTDFITWTG